MYFPRNHGPLLSVLLPSRARVPWLINAANSLYATAIDRHNVEIIVKLDDNDQESQAAVKYLPPRTKVVVTPRGNGYPDMPRWLDEMMLLATGDWVLGFNDDAFMWTHGWDDILANLDPRRDPNWHGSHGVCLLNCADSEGKPTTVLPLVRRTACHYLGHVSKNAHFDTWLQEVYAPLNAVHAVPEIRIHHHYHKPDGPFPFSVVAGSTSYPDLISDASKAARAADTERLRSIL